MDRSDAVGIYVHLPFCRIRCSYCPFAISTDKSLEDAYAGALLKEVETTRVDASVDTLYFGGGTPSYTAPRHFLALLARLRDLYRFAPALEFTIEANPEDVTPDAIELWKQAGVSRVSLGVQSFNDAELFPLGRGHARARAIEALDLLAASSLRVNADLIIGLPKQTRETFLESLDLAIVLGAGHLSIYMLDLEEGTVLDRQARRGWVKLPQEELVEELYFAAIERTADAGIGQYEVSNFARPGEESLHNLRYWRRLPYLGLGLGAHSFIPPQRRANSREIGRYIESMDATGDATDFRETIGAGEARREQLLLTLRQVDGIGYPELAALCGEEGRAWSERGIEEGWLQRRGDRLAFTPAGFVLSNEYISQLF